MSSALDQRPFVVAVNGPNRVGKKTFYHSHPKVAGLRYSNADILAREFDMKPYSAAQSEEHGIYLASLLPDWFHALYPS